MRLSAERKDRAYNKDFFKYKVLLDGVEQTYWLTADEEKGEIRAWIPTPTGRVATDFYGVPQVITKIGKVEIVRR